MDGILEWGYDVIRWVQTFSPALDVPFKLITALGSETVFLLLLPLIFWCVDKRHGARLGILLMLSVYVNDVLKGLFRQPRPSPDEVQVLVDESNFGLPSGHSQNSIAVYGFLVSRMARAKAWIITGLIAFSVGLSRVYLGVHFPSDVLAGWFVGLLLLLVYLWGLPWAELFLSRLSWRQKVGLAVTLPIIIFFLHVNATSAQLMGTLMGLLVAVLVEFRWVKFSAQGAWQSRAIRFGIGIVILLALWGGTGAIFPSADVEAGAPGMLVLLLRFFRYTLVGLWVGLGAPWLFMRLGVAAREEAA